jgi:hypothetical protein
MSLPAAMVKASAKCRETNDCAVKAIAIATSTDYLVVHELCRKLGRKKGKGTHLYVMENAIQQLGWKINRNVKWKGKTATTLKLPFAGRFLAFTTRYSHVLAVRGGLVKDWTDGRRYRIESVWEIKKIS